MLYLLPFRKQFYVLLTILFTYFSITFLETGLYEFSESVLKSLNSYLVFAIIFPFSDGSFFKFSGTYSEIHKKVDGWKF